MSHPREQIEFPPAVAHSLNEAVQVEAFSVLFLDSGGQCASDRSLLFSIREVTSVAIIAGDMQAMTGVSEMAQKLMNSFEDAMAIMDHADTESAAYDKASSTK